MHSQLCTSCTAVHRLLGWFLPHRSTPFHRAGSVLLMKIPAHILVLHSSVIFDVFTAGYIMHSRAPFCLGWFLPHPFHRAGSVLLMKIPVHILVLHSSVIFDAFTAVYIMHSRAPFCLGWSLPHTVSTPFHRAGSVLLIMKNSNRYVTQQCTSCNNSVWLMKIHSIYYTAV